MARDNDSRPDAELEALRAENAKLRKQLSAIEEKIVEIEDTQFGGYVGEGDLVGELDWLSGEITAERAGKQREIDALKTQMSKVAEVKQLVEREEAGESLSSVTMSAVLEARGELAEFATELQNLCFEMGLEPRRGMWDASYYGNLLRATIGDLRAEAADSRSSREAIDPHGLLDPKGHVVLETFAIEGHALPDAVVFCGPQAVEPFVVAHGYDETDGEWLSGTYFTDVGYAHDKADPEIIEDATSRWCLDDIRKPLLEEGLAASARNIQEVLTPSGYGSSFSELVAGDGITSELNAEIAETVLWMKDVGRFDKAPAARQERASGDASRDNSRADAGYSLDSACKAASEAKDSRVGERSSAVGRDEIR